jgi:Invasion associated locus B (IalB) protein
MIVRILAANALILAATTMALSQAAQPIGSFSQWNAYTYSDSEGKSCYIASRPQNSKYSQEISGRDPAFFLITTRISSDPSKTVRNEASTIVGYPFKPDSSVTVDVDGQKFTMFTREDNAWFNDRNSESAFIEAMKAGTKMTVEGTSGRGTVSTDEYSLSGVTAGLKAVADACP